MSRWNIFLRIKFSKEGLQYSGRNRPFSFCILNVESKACLQKQSHHSVHRRKQARNSSFLSRVKKKKGTFAEFNFNMYRLSTNYTEHAVLQTISIPLIYKTPADSLLVIRIGNMSLPRLVMRV